MLTTRLHSLAALIRKVWLGFAVSMLVMVFVAEATVVAALDKTAQPTHLLAAPVSFALPLSAPSFISGSRKEHPPIDLRVLSANLQIFASQYCTPPLCLSWSSTESEWTQSVAWGDVDGDGDLDLAVGNMCPAAGDPNCRAVRLYRNNHGVLTVSAVWSSSETAFTNSIAWGDYDGDGDLDLMAGIEPTINSPCHLCFTGGQNRLYRNDEGVLTSSAVYSTTATDDTTSVAWGDYDGDGDLDLAVGNRRHYDYTLQTFINKPSQLYRNDGGVLTLSPVYSTTESGSDTYSVAWGDYDGDGDLDLAVGNDGQPNRLYRNDGGGLIPGAVYSTTEIASTRSVAWGDYDGDGDLDLAVGNYGQPNRIYRNDSGVLTPGAVYSTTESDLTTSVAWGDYDGDGDLDLAVGNNQQPSRIYRNDGGILTASVVWSSNESSLVYGGAWGDYDGDGSLDLAVASGDAPTRLYHNDGSVLAPSAVWSSSDTTDANTMAWGDYDNDGDLDLVAAPPIRLYRNDGGTLMSNPVYTAADSINVTSVAWGDYDKDGDLDLAAGAQNSPAEPSRLYRNDGGVLTPGAVYSTTETDPTQSVAWGDYDADGDLDLVVGNDCNTSSNASCRSSRLYRNDNGVLTASAVWSSIERDFTMSLAWADYDSDGDLDLAAGNYRQPNRLYRNDNGVLTSSAVWSSTENDSTIAVAWGDYDGDGDIDLAVGNWLQPNRLYRNDNGMLTASAFWSSIEGDQTTSIAWGDGDGDGDLDLAVGNYNADPGGQPNRLYRNDNGQLTPGAAWSSAESDNTFSVAWGDYDDDGGLDLAAGNSCFNNPPGCRSIRLYHNGRNVPLHNSIPTVGLVRSLAKADFFSSSQVNSGTLPINYTLSNPEGDPLGSLRAFYSPDGGGTWHTATAASGTLTTNLSTRSAFSAFKFDGVDDIAVISDSSSLDLSAFSLGAWVKPLQIKSNWQPLITKENASTSGRNYGLYISPNQMQVHLSFYDSDCTTWNGIYSTGVLTLGQWNYVVATYDGAQAKIYLNGILDTFVPINKSVCQNNEPIRLGGVPGAYTGFAGDLDEVTLWNVARTQAQIQTYLTQTLTGNEAGLVGYWTADEGTGLVAYDPTRNANHAHLLNGATWDRGAPGLTASTGQAVQFDGVNDYIGVTAPISIPLGNSAYSIEGWIKPNAMGAGGILGWGNYGVTGQANAFRLTPTGLVNYWWGGDLYATTGPLTDTWHHVAATFDGVTRRIYVDGVLRASDTPAISHAAPASNFRIGLTNTGENFNGQIDEVRVWNVARTQAQIQTYMTQTLQGNEAGLVGYWPLDEGNGRYAYDHTANGNHGALANGPQWVAGRPLPTTATPIGLSFNGVNNYVTIPNSASLNPTTELALAAWVKLSNPANNQKVIAKSNTPFGSGYNLAVSTNQIYSEIWDSTGALYAFTAGSISANQWTHLALTWKTGGSMKAYINGTLVYSMAASLNPINANAFPLQIGEALFGYPTTGQIDDVRVYTHELSANDIQYIMVHAADANTPGLVGYWRLDEGSGLTAYDQTANGNNGTLVNGPLWTSGAPMPVQHIFNWDVYNSGFFGQSDNMVFRIEAYPSLSSRANGVPVFQRPYASATTFPFRVRGTQVRVISGTVPISNAIVYRLPATQTLGASLITDAANNAFHTDGQGYLQGRGRLGIGDKLVALLPITGTGTYTLYYTSAAPTPTGLNMDSVTGGGVQTLTVSSANPLILFNLDVSLEWDARQDTQYLEQLQFNLRRASEVLYDASNGQAAIGNVTIYHNRDHWDTAMVRVYANNRLRPFASVGGIVITPTVDPVTTSGVITYTPGQVSIGVTWNRYGDAGVSVGEDWPRTLAHELGHYLLFQDDDYLGLDANGQLTPVSACSGTIMADPYRDDFSEFKPTASWLPGCADTLANKATGRSDWATVKQFYPALNAPGTANTGPSSLPLAVTQIRFIEPITPTTTLPDPRFYIKDAGGASQQPGASTRAFLFRADGIVDLGRPVVDQLLARGAQPGDRVCVFEPDTARLGCKSIVSNDDQQLTLTSVAGWQPEIVARPINSTTVIISGTLPGITAGTVVTASLYDRDGGAPIVILPIVGAGSAFSGPFNLNAPIIEGYVDVRVHGSAGEVVLEYSLGGSPANKRSGFANKRSGFANKRSGFAPVLSGDGQVIIYRQNLNFPENEFYTLQTATRLPSVPVWATVVGRGYWLTKSTGAPALSGASISMSYPQNEVPAGQESFIRVNYWNGATWTALTTTVSAEDNSAFAPIAGEGLYTLFASIEIPLSGPGWNGFAYPLQTPQPITQALQSIAGGYTTLYWYDASDALDHWKMYDVAVPTYTIDLNQLEYLQPYWILLNGNVTVRFGGEASAAPNLPAQSNQPDDFQLPPATFYGAVSAGPGFTPSAGQTVTAWVNGVQCGQSQTLNVAGQIVYSLNVSANGPGALSCGTAGASVAFKVSGVPMSSAPWSDNRPVSFALSPVPYSLYLPLIHR